MSSNDKLADFPDVQAKLQKPSKQSAFEKQKAEAEAKRKREAAETAAVYESFVKSFDNDDDDGNRPPAASARQQGAPFGRSGPNTPQYGGPSRRHFGAATSGMKSGPGSLGPAPTSFNKKRFDNVPSHQHGYNRKAGDDARGRLGFGEDDGDGGWYAPRSKGISRVFNTSDDEADAKARDLAEEKAIARPTLRLANLPPGTSPAVIKALMPASLNVEAVKVLPPQATVGTERKSMAAIVTLSQETPATDIDSAVSSLQNRYLGFGFYLSLHRHLSSAVIATTASNITTSSTSHAFGAKSVPQAAENSGYQPGGFHRGFAPPTSYNPMGGGPISKTILHVPVQPPRDIKQIQLIHKVVESVLDHGPEFEALLMSRPDVQREEKWAWLWDARSEGGIWYRWRLWEVYTGVEANKGRQGKYLPLFEGSHAWRMPEKPLVYEYTTAVDEFVSDPEYNSSDDEEFEEEGNKTAEGGETEKTYLNPLDKAKLTHLLARLPTTLTKIRKGDVARITTFGITHSSRGADEIVDMIVANVVKPFALTSANPEHKRNTAELEQGRGSHDSITPLPEDAAAKAAEAQDTSAASLVGLYVVSDILSSSATSGVRHAWRYRQLFETALKQSKVFEVLGLMAERHNWGRLRAEKWKRSVHLVLSLWEGWCAFPNETQQLFTQTFENPPKPKKEEQTEESLKKTGKWKTVDASEQRGFLPVSTKPDEEEAAEDVDGDAMDDDAEMLDAEMDSDIDGVPMDSDDGEPMDQDPSTSVQVVAT